MSLILDGLGFPYIKLKSGGAVGLFPVLKVQFEYLFGEVNGFKLIDYDATLELCPRLSWRAVQQSNEADGVFLLGVLPSEAATICEAFGERQLPAPEQWREAYAALNVPFSREACEQLLKLPRLHPAAASLLRRPAVRRWFDFGAGYLEWVASNEGYGLYGDPRSDFKLNWLNNCSLPKPMIPRQHQRHRAYGFRWFWTGKPEGRTR